MRKLPKDQLKQAIALGILLLITGFAIGGPTGLLTWNDQAKLLEQREEQIIELTRERDELLNRVELLDTDSADPDLVGELLRENLNVVHTDEVVITLEEE